MPKMSKDRLTKRAVEGAAPGSYAWDSDVRGFGVRVTPAGTRSFVYRYTTPAPSEADAKKRKQQFDVLGGFPALTVEQAREMARAKAAKGRDADHRGERRRALEEKASAKTLRDLADYYLGDYAKAKLRPATVRDARAVLFDTQSRPGFIPVAMLAKRVEEVSQADVLRLHGDAHEAGGPFLANRLLAVLSRMFTLAEGRGWRTGRNPCRGVGKYAEDARSRALLESEVARLLDACDGYVGADPKDGRNAADAVRLLLYTGARLREVLRAEWSQFDLERGLWVKPSSHTKTKKQHRLEVAGPALDLLREMREREPTGRFLFAGKPLETSPGRWEEKARADLKRPWTWIAREAGLKDVRLHDLRRTNASFMLSGGASLATVGKTLGHTQAATTQRYAYMADAVAREASRSTGERMAALRGTAPKGTVVALKRGA